MSLNKQRTATARQGTTQCPLSEVRYAGEYSDRRERIYLEPKKGPRHTPKRRKK